MAKLTVKQLEALLASQDGGKLRDEGGLIGTIKSKADGVSVYFDWRYRFEGKVRQIQVGSWPKETLSGIRKERDRLQEMVRTGTDPAAIRHAMRLEKKADQAQAIAQQQSRLDQIAIQQARMTVRQLFEKWERLELKNRKDKGAETKRCFEKDIFPTLGNLAAEDVKRAMIASCLDKVVERNAPILARNLLGDLRQMFGFAIKREYVENDPTSHLKRDDFGKKVERDRFLNEEEIKFLHRLLPDAHMQEARTAAIWIMISTLCRVGEISRARWSDIDLDDGTWRIPPENAKNAKEHTVFLSDFSRQHFEALKKLATDDLGNLSTWAMPASQKDSHVCVKSLAKQIGDRQRGADSKPMSNRTKLTSALILPRGKWTPHDLRRTGATMMGNLGVRPDVIEKCMNHVEQNALVRIYQRQSLEAEQRAAWKLLGERLDLLTRDTKNVVTLDASKKIAEETVKSAA
jgi:integrase